MFPVPDDDENLQLRLFQFPKPRFTFNLICDTNSEWTRDGQSQKQMCLTFIIAFKLA